MIALSNFLDNWKHVVVQKFSELLKLTFMAKWLRHLISNWMSVGSNPTPGVDISNEQEELLLEMMEVEELLVLWLKLEKES